MSTHGVHCPDPCRHDNECPHGRSNLAGETCAKCERLELRCPHGRTRASRIDNPCPEGFDACWTGPTTPCVHCDQSTPMRGILGRNMWDEPGEICPRCQILTS